MTDTGNLEYLLLKKFYKGFLDRKCLNHYVNQNHLLN